MPIYGSKNFVELADQGVITSLDPNIRGLLVKNKKQYLDRLERMSKHANILKLSDEDLNYMRPEASLDDAFIEICNTTSAEIIVLTMGSEGARVKAGEIYLKWVLQFAIRWLIQLVLEILLWV